MQAIYLGGMVENTAFDQVYHEHLCYYTLRSLAALLARHGLEVFEARLVPIHGGTIEAHVARKGRRPVGESVRAHAGRGGAQGLRRDRHLPRVSHATSGTARRAACRCWRLYATRASAYGPIGAPAKGATLLNSFGIGPDLVQKAVERNPMKVGLRDSGRAHSHRRGTRRGEPDAYLVLAWNFIDEFLKNPANIAFMQGGGEFIVPVPEVQVVGASGARQV